MARKILYTIGRPQAELDAMREIIMDDSGLDTHGLHLYDITARRDYGRVYYAVLNPETETGLLFFISPARGTQERQELLADYEIADLFKLAKTLGLYKFRMLPALRLYEDEIQATVDQRKVDPGTFFNANNL